MRFHELRRILQQVVIAGIPATAAGCVEAVIDTDCIDTFDRSYHFDTPADDPPLQFQIERCRVDVDACPDLCKEAMERDSVTQAPSRCEVTFRDSSVDVDVSYEDSIGGDGCPTELSPAGLPEPEPPPTAAELSPAAPGRSDGPQVRGPRTRTRTFDSMDLISMDLIWNGGRTCHA